MLDFLLCGFKSSSAAGAKQELFLKSIRTKKHLSRNRKAPSLLQRRKKVILGGSLFLSTVRINRSFIIISQFFI